MDNTFKFNQPWILQRADPFVLYENGWYYFTASVPAYDSIVLRRSRTLEGLAEAEEKVLWVKHESGIMSEHIWAPELHFLFGKWYIYFAGGDKDDVWEIRPYVLECTGDDPYEDPWVERGMMQCADDDPFSFRAFSLDATVFEDNGTWYYIWAEKVGVGKQISNLYIAKMESATKLATVQVLLTTPDYDWERRGFWVNEGPGPRHHPPRRQDLPHLLCERDGHLLLRRHADRDVREGPFRSAQLEEGPLPGLRDGRLEGSLRPGPQLLHGG